jgi:Domain of unknown function (DUF4150)
MVFANSSGPIPAPDFGFPDVCLTPIVVPVPIPYPNLQLAPVAIPTQFRVFSTCMPNHNVSTVKPISLGDQPGVNLGVASGLVMGPVRHLLGSFRVFTGGPPQTRAFVDLTGHNGGSPNIPGMTLAPSQVRVLVLA